MSGRCLAVTLLLLGGLPAVARAHDVFPGSEVNPPSEEGDRANARLTFLAEQGRRAGVGDAEVEAARGIYYKKYLWTKSSLKVCFWNGSEPVQRDIMKVADVWHRAVPAITFDFEEAGHVRRCDLADLADFHRMADIRITLDAGDARALWNATDLAGRMGDWSYPGRAVAQDPAYPTTMSLVGAAASLQRHLMTDYTFNVRHEFGHALGLAHEHQNSVCDGWFDIKAIAASQGWTEAYTRAQVGSLGDTSNQYGIVGGYDIDSIMQYNFALSWYAPDRPGAANPCRRKADVDDLSEMDKVVVAQLYEPSLNATPERVALIARRRDGAARAAAQLAASAPAQPVAATVGPTVQASLGGFGATLEHPATVQIQVFLHPLDKDVVIRALSNLGYPLEDDGGHRIATVGHPTRSLQKDPTNAVLYTADAPEQDVRFIALGLLNAGIEVKSVEPYLLGVNNGFTTRHQLVQIGASVRNRARKPLSREDVLTRALPMYGAPLPADQP